MTVLRTPAQLRDAGLIAPERAAGLAGGGGALCGGAAGGSRRADRPRRSARSDRAPVRARRGRARSAPGRIGRSDRRRRLQPGRRRGASLSRPRAAQADARLRGLLPLLLPPRNGRTGQGQAACRRQALARALDYIRAHDEIWEVILTGGDPLVLSARRLRAVMKALRRDRSRQGGAHPHARAGGRARPHHARACARAEGERQGDLRRRARQSCARTDAGRARRLRAPGRCRPGAARAIGAARRRQRHGRRRSAS